MPFKWYQSLKIGLEMRKWQVNLKSVDTIFEQTLVLIFNAFLCYKSMLAILKLIFFNHISLYPILLFFFKDNYSMIAHKSKIKMVYYLY